MTNDDSRFKFVYDKNSVSIFARRLLQDPGIPGGSISFILIDYFWLSNLFAAASILIMNVLKCLIEMLFNLSTNFDSDQVLVLCWQSTKV